MNTQTIDAAVVEAKRFLQRVEELKAEEADAARKGITIYSSTFSKQRGAVRRASMDLTRALTDMRRPG
jgi:hypothetical protein